MWIDSHAHLSDLSEFDLYATLSRADDAGVTSVLNVGTDLQTSRMVLEQSNRGGALPLYAAVGISAADVDKYTEGDRKWRVELDALAADPRTTAIGEIGIDGVNESYAPFDKQLSFFRAQLAIARKFSLPVIVHSRGVEALALEEVRVAGVERAVFHCYTGDVETAIAMASAGYYVSFSGIVTFKRSDYNAVIRAVRLDRLLVETDSPYLAPEPFRGRVNEPARAAIVGRYCAGVLHRSEAELAAVVQENFHRLFLS